MKHRKQARYAFNNNHNFTRRLDGSAREFFSIFIQQLKAMHSKTIFSILVASLMINQLTTAQQPINFKKITSTAELFGPGTISTGMNERDFALSPDGKELFYSVQVQPSLFHAIITMKKDHNGKWSKPEVAAFSGHYSDLEPAYSPDGNWLYFSSNRPLNGDKPKDFDIWRVEKINGAWSNPKPVTEINTSANEYYPSVSASGNIYFTAEYKNGIGREDIYCSKWENGQFLTPVPLDTNVNSKTYEFNAFVSPDEHFILFSSYGRPDDKGRGDLYISIKNQEGKWQPAKNLSMLNSDRLDYCPFVSFDKKILFFTSEKHLLPSSYNGKAITYAALQKVSSDPMNGGGNIYWISWETVLQSVK